MNERKFKVDFTINIWTVIGIVGMLAVAIYRLDQVEKRQASNEVVITTLLRENAETHGILDKRLSLLEHDASRISRTP